MNGVATTTAGRTASFGLGTAEATSPINTTPFVPIKFRPTSVLNQTASSDNGLSGEDYHRHLLGLSVTPNGSSDSTFSKVSALKYPFINTF